jgi:hypothetical protein
VDQRHAEGFFLLPLEDVATAGGADDEQIGAVATAGEVGVGAAHAVRGIAGEELCRGELEKTFVGRSSPSIEGIETASQSQRSWGGPATSDGARLASAKKRPRRTARARHSARNLTK